MFDPKQHADAARAKAQRSAADVNELEQRVIRLKAAGRTDDAAPLERQVDTHWDRTHGIERHPATTILARAAQALYQNAGQHLPAVAMAEAKGDELVAAVLKASVSPSTTSSEVLGPVVLGPLIAALAPESVVVRRVMPTVMPGRVAGMRSPKLDTGPAPAWVAEGAAIPVVAGAFLAGPTLAPRKLAAIVVGSAELFERSEFAGLLQSWMQRRIGQALDARFFASTALANAPDGIFAVGSGQSVAASALTTAIGAVADFSNLIEAAVSAGIDLSSASFVLNPVTRAKLNAVATTGGHLPFFNAADFAGVPIEQSAGVPAGRIGLVSWGSVLAVTSDLPGVEVAHEALLHMDDAPNADIAVPTSGERSLFATDCGAMLVRFPIHWNNMHATAALYCDAVAWD